MIKRYNQFIKENDDFMEEPSFEETEGRLAAEDLDQEMDSFNNEPENSEEFEEEGEDLYASKLQELADKLGTEVVNGKVEFEGKTVIFPSETEMYHIDKKKFKTSDEVVDYLQGSENKMQELPEESEQEVVESKSYKNRFKI